MLCGTCNWLCSALYQRLFNLNICSTNNEHWCCHDSQVHLNDTHFMDLHCNYTLQGRTHCKLHSSDYSSYTNMNLPLKNYFCQKAMNPPLKNYFCQKAMNPPLKNYFCQKAMKYIMFKQNCNLWCRWCMLLEMLDRFCAHHRNSICLGGFGPLLLAAHFLLVPWRVTQPGKISCVL